MRSTLVSRLVLLFLLVATGIVSYMSFLPGHPTLPLIASSVMAPDAYMEEVNAWIMDKEGRLSMKIIAPKLIHYKKDDQTNLTSPLITLYRQSPMPWYISSRTALATGGIENVNFHQDVVIRHASDLNTPETIIKTTSLLVHPNAKTAETNDLITMLQPNLTVKSIGMFANMNSGDIKLLSKPRGEYVPNS